MGAGGHFRHHTAEARMFLQLGVHDLGQDTPVGRQHGGGALGHPAVYYDMGDADFVECLYCDRRFVATTAVGDEDEILAPGVYEGAGGH